MKKRVVQLTVLQYELCLASDNGLYCCDSENSQKQPRGKGAKSMGLPLYKATLIKCMVVCPAIPALRRLSQGHAVGLRPG